MRTIHIAECGKDIDRIGGIIGENAPCGRHREVGVFLAPNLDDCDCEWGREPWVVVDSRARDVRRETFATLDGALSYATDGHVTMEDVSGWDEAGRFNAELAARCRTFDGEPDGMTPVAPGSDAFRQAKEARSRKWADDERATFAALHSDDRFTTSMQEGDPEDELVAAFVDSVVDDPNGIHGIEFAVDGTGRRLVRVTFRNEAGQTVRVDGILENFNMENWRQICDRFSEKMVRKAGGDPEDADWPTPRPKVTYSAEPDGGDVIASVEIGWETDEATWQMMKDATAILKVERAGREAARHATEENRQTKGKAGKDSDEREIHEWCSNCETEVRMRWDVGRDGYVIHCPKCGERMHLCDACREAADGREAYGNCDFSKGEKCFRDKGDDDE